MLHRMEAPSPLYQKGLHSAVCDQEPVTTAHAHSISHKRWTNRGKQSRAAIADPLKKQASRLFWFLCFSLLWTWLPASMSLTCYRILPNSRNEEDKTEKNPNALLLVVSVSVRYPEVHPWLPTCVTTATCMHAKSLSHVQLFWPHGL